jgi:hypothetical protein
MIHIISLAVLSCPGHCLFPLVQSVSSVALYWVHRGYSYDAAGLHCILLISGLLFCLQDGKTLPNGPVVISPDGLFPSLYREGKVFLKIIRSMELLGLQINFLIQALMIPAS